MDRRSPDRPCAFSYQTDEPPFGDGPIVTTSNDVSKRYALSGRKVWRDSGWFIGAGASRIDAHNPDSMSLDFDSEQDGHFVPVAAQPGV